MVEKLTEEIKKQADIHALRIVNDFKTQLYNLKGDDSSITVHWNGNTIYIDVVKNDAIKHSYSHIMESGVYVWNSVQSAKQYLIEAVVKYLKLAFVKTTIVIG